MARTIRKIGLRKENPRSKLITRNIRGRHEAGSYSNEEGEDNAQYLGIIINFFGFGVNGQNALILFGGKR